ncbi:lamin tail domain-containing protein [Chondromyces apiculatus]|uniref:Extracellular nuclease n=1 Tax=Chondromyces apiculatus DSM 436 TaxID=1192034 RepID=A0A017TH55_9BACT|nr:lamin tail domain-containing protein [Chondromyces apiculatus]EYF07951.1 extracellular nuclease [Chondromyces apiculatus DSM 436]
MLLTARRTSLALVFLTALASAAFSACGGDDDGNNPTGSGGDTGVGGAGGAGGGASGAPEHLLISEVMLSVDPAEFVEIWNPTDAEVDLTDHYLSDNGTYHRIATGTPFTPAGSPGLDFLVQFPPGTRIAAGATLTLAAHPDFEAEHGRCADLALTSAPVSCSTGTPTPPMIAPENGALGSMPGLLTNDGEMVVLFTWSGVEDEPVRDVDYVAWGADLGSSEIVDKSTLPGYSGDTPAENQKLAPLAGTDESLERCRLESGETTKGGNGITGHNETSEDFAASFVVTATPSPGAVNPCLDAL